MKSRIAFGIVLVLAAAFVATPTPAFHGAWWKATGSVAVSGTPLPVKVDWSGRQLGDQGAVTIRIFLPNNPVPIHQNTLQVQEIWVNVFFQGCVEFVDPYQHVGVVPGTWTLTGTMRNDLCTGLNDNDFIGLYLGAIPMTLKSAGGFGVAHG